jgi:hypothetical protein
VNIVIALLIGVALAGAGEQNDGAPGDDEPHARLALARPMCFGLFPTSRSCRSTSRPTTLATIVR